MKNRILILFISLSSHGYICAQDSAFVPDFYFSVQGAPVVSYRSISTKSSDVVYLTSSMEARQKMKTGYSSGLRMTYHFKKWMKFETGLEFCDLGYKEEVEQLTYGIQDQDLPISAKSFTHFQYLKIPLLLQYSFNPRIPMVFVSYGINGYWLVKQNTTTIFKYSDSIDRGFNENGDKSDFNNICFSACVGVGVYSSLNENKTWYSKVESFMSYFLTSASTSNIKMRLYYFGLNVGITRKF